MCLFLVLKLVLHGQAPLPNSKENFPWVCNPLLPLHCEASDDLTNISQQAHCVSLKFFAFLSTKWQTHSRNSKKAHSNLTVWVIRWALYEYGVSSHLQLDILSCQKTQNDASRVFTKPGKNSEKFHFSSHAGPLGAENSFLWLLMFYSTWHSSNLLNDKGFLSFHLCIQTIVACQDVSLWMFLLSQYASVYVIFLEGIVTLCTE